MLGNLQIFYFFSKPITFVEEITYGTITHDETILTSKTGKSRLHTYVSPWGFL